MNRREAKRLVCLCAATLLETGPNLWLGFTAGGDGATLRDSDPDCLDEPLSEADAARMAAALEELVEELRRRGGE